jgi:hypothetical protein
VIGIKDRGKGYERGEGGEGGEGSERGVVIYVGNGLLGWRQRIYRDRVKEWD